MKSKFPLYCVLLLITISCKERRSDKKGLKMQEFVIDIASYAKAVNSNFLVIPQNGAELSFDDLDPSNGFNSAYMSSIDGLGIEELYYNGVYSPDAERIAMLKQFSGVKPVLVSEYIKEANQVADAIQKNADNGFLCFPRSSDNYDYKEIPTQIQNENAENIFQLSDAKNYLYLISTEGFSLRQDMISAISATNYDVVIIDLFYGDTPLTKSEVEGLKTKQNGAKRLLISYMNIGSAENYRYYWKDKWKLHRPLWLKKEYDGYEDEIWVKFWKKEWQEIIFGNDNSYTKKILNAGFDGVYLDNVEAYYFLYFE